MPLPWADIKAYALAFSNKWIDATDDASEAQNFLNDLFGVFDIDRKRVGTFETKVPMETDRSGYIYLLWKGISLVEVKSF